MENVKPRLFEKCGNCGQEISKDAPIEVYQRHYDAECMNDKDRYEGLDQNQL